MSLTSPVGSDHQLARLLQIGVVLEEVVEARAAKHTESGPLDDELESLLEAASEESAQHRKQLDALVDELDAETIPFDEIQGLVESQYESGDDFDGVLYDQLCNEETAYKFYDDLIEAIESSEAEFSIERDRLLSILREIRDAEEAGVEEVTNMMEQRE